MKTKAILTTLLIAAAASADARFAWPYPPKAVSPDEIGHWVVINGNAWPDCAESELTTASPLLSKTAIKAHSQTDTDRIQQESYCAPSIGSKFSNFLKCRSSNA